MFRTKKNALNRDPREDRVYSLGAEPDLETLVGT